jgi:cardiolipin synthase
MIILGISGLSDMFDGMIARKLHQESKLGEMLDPIADKLTLMSIVICFAINFPVVFPVIILMFLKEIIMLLGGLYLIGENIDPPKAKWYGKLSTVVFYTVTIIIVALQAIWGIKDDMMALILVGIAAIFMIYTLVRYTIMFFKLLKEKRAE